MDGCGFWFWHPQWLQRFAKTRWYICVYALLGTLQSSATTYFNITLTTMEKRFRIPSQTTGLILSGNEVSQILLSLVLSYFGGQKNSPRWLSWGIVASALSSFILACPHLVYGAGEDALQYTQEYVPEINNVSTGMISTNNNSNNNKLCQNSTSNIDYCDEEFSYVPLILIFMSQFVLGIGNTLFYSLGSAYIDDNSRQNKSPLFLSYAYTMRILGPTFGYGFAYLLLKIYIAPTLTPIIPNNDPRWLGAWWLGWLIIGTVMLVFAVLIGLFPRKIRKEKSPEEEHELHSEKCEKNTELNKKHSEIGEDEGRSLKDFSKAVWRLMNNKLLMLNAFDAVFYILGYSGSMTYMGKLMEVQFNKTAAGGSIITGPSVMIGMAIGMLCSGILISKFKPRSSLLFFWNVIVGLIVLFATISYSQMGCENSNSMEVNGTIFACNSNCSCDGISFSPVCDHSTATTYFSPCHAGCKTFDVELNVYTRCICSYDEPKDKMQTERTVVPGACAGNCDFDFYLYSFIFMLSNFLGITGWIGNILLPFRSVAPKDKAMGQGLSLFITSLFALIPGPIIFGRIIDSTCLIWKNKCGRRGNCLLYDPVKFRYYLHISSAGFISIGVLFDFLIWYFGRNLDLFGDSSDDKLKTIEKKKKIGDSHENEPFTMK